MYKATRALIDARAPFCSYPLSRVKVRRLFTSSPQNCFLNAVENEYVDCLDSGSSKNEIISGWIVYPFDKANRATEIVQHWWNYDPVAKEHFDTTSFDPSVAKLDVEYVVDLEIKNEGVRQLAQIASNVGYDLLFDGKVWRRTREGADGVYVFDQIPDLRTKNLLIYR